MKVFLHDRTEAIWTIQLGSMEFTKVTTSDSSLHLIFWYIFLDFLLGLFQRLLDKTGRSARDDAKPTMLTLNIGTSLHCTAFTNISWAGTLIYTQMILFWAPQWMVREWGCYPFLLTLVGIYSALQFCWHQTVATLHCSFSDLSLLWRMDTVLATLSKKMA